MLKKALYVGAVALPVATAGVFALKYRLPIGPVVLALAVFPIAGLLLARRSVLGAVPDLVFGAIDSGLLTIPALWGAMLFGTAGAIAGSIIGDALTDAIAGFFEGSVAQWLSKRGIRESREAVSTALGKLTGCLLGSGLVLSLALCLGINPVG